MRIHFFQHVPFEGPAAIEPWLRQRGYAPTFTRFFESDPVYPSGTVDWLIIMGGPMSVNDESAFPWLRTEKQLIGKALTSGTRILGICLGAQLLADVLGAMVFRNRETEIGWFPVTLTEAGIRSRWFSSAVQNTITPFHWHGETFDLPAGADLLASSEACSAQAFSYGSQVLGLQFHIESTPESISDLILHSREDLKPGQFVQPEAVLRTGPPGAASGLGSVLEGVLSAFAANAEPVR